MRGIFLAAMAALALCGCGGGGGEAGGGGPTVAVLSSRNAFEPTTIFAGQFKGFSFTVDVNRQPDPARPRYTGPVHVVMREAGIAMDPHTVGLILLGDEAYTAAARTKTDLPVGRYRDTFRVRLCVDAGCREVLAEKRVAYDITVKADTGGDPRPLAPFTNLGMWGQQPGYVPVTLDPARFSARWLWAVHDQEDYARLGVPVSDPDTGIAYVLSGNPGNKQRLVAFREDDHSEVWSKDWNGWLLGGPTVSNGRLWLSARIDGHGQVIVYDAASGTLLTHYSVPMEDAIYTYPNAPVVSGDRVFVNFGSDIGRGHVMAFSADDFSHLWTSDNGGGSYAGVSADENHVYFYRPNKSTDSTEGFTALHRASGAKAFSQGRAPLPLSPTGDAISNDGATPLPDGKGGVLVGSGGKFSQNFIYRYDLATRQPLWEVSALRDVLAVAGETVYVGSEGTPTLDAYRLGDGLRLWQWNPPELRGMEFTFYSMLVTNNLIFISTNQEVYALNRVTREVVWSYPAAGHLAISPAGLLYISRFRDSPSGTWPEGKLAAINLK